MFIYLICSFLHLYLIAVFLRNHVSPQLISNDPFSGASAPTEAAADLDYARIFSAETTIDLSIPFTTLSQAPEQATGHPGPQPSWLSELLLLIISKLF